MAFEDFFDEVKFDYDIEKKKFIDNMNYLQTMSVEEQTLYKKWQEFNKDVYSMTKKASKFERLDNSIWMPTDI
jgi:argininosuccinate synthase